MGKARTDFLVASPSFLMGAATILNLGGNFSRFNTSENPDELAIAMDWAMVAQDLNDVMQDPETPLKVGEWMS